MPNEDTHVATAKHCHDVLNHLDQEDKFCDWVAVLAFYKGLHIVDAVLWNDSDKSHGVRHGIRLNKLKRTRRYKDIYKRFQRLHHAAQIARYLRPPGNDDGPAQGDDTFTAFDQYMNAEQVRETLVGEKLKEMIQHARNFLSPVHQLLT